MKIFQRVKTALRYYLQSIDKWLILCCLLLSTLSFVFLYGLTGSGYSGMGQVYTQIIATVLGLIAAVFISLLDYRQLVKLWKIYLPLAVLLVALTFFVGVERGSNRAWLGLRLFGFSFTIQPAEFLKISFIMTFSHHLSRVKEDINRISSVLLLCLHGMFYVGLVLIQRDAGTALVFVGMFAIMMFMADIGWKYILAAFGALIPAVPIVWNFFMSEDQKVRFRVMRDPTISDRYAFQQRQGLKSMGLGGVTGVGFDGKHVFVPESYNDFIFTYIGQVAGLIGLLGVMILLLLLVGKLLYNANHSSDQTGRMICVGVMSMILIQSIMNIGMCINILPVIGVTLPFLSAGGTSVLSMYLGIGLVLSVYRHQVSEFFDPSR